MKIILTQEVKNLGTQGDVVQVADGYARNYLIPKGLAVAATAGNLKEVEKMKNEQAKKEAEEKAEAEKLAGRLQGQMVTLKAKSGEGGKLFGSITGQDIAQALGEVLGVKIDKRKVELKEPLKALGEYQVPVRLYRDLAVNITVQVQPEE